MSMEGKLVSNLFQLGDFISHSGVPLDWKIDVDALGDDDLKCLALIGSQKVPLFSEVIGIPRGGLRFAKEMVKYTREEGGILLVDDVLTTGASMVEWQKKTGARSGLVIFSRRILTKPHWVTSIFTIT